MKDMHGKSIKVGDIVRVHVWGADKKYHPVYKIISTHKTLLGMTRVRLKSVPTGFIRECLHNPTKDIAKVELEDLI